MSNLSTSTSIAIDSEAVNVQYAKKTKSGNKKFAGKCHHCNIVGHKEVNCRK